MPGHAVQASIMCSMCIITVYYISADLIIVIFTVYTCIVSYHVHVQHADYCKYSFNGIFQNSMETDSMETDSMETDVFCTCTRLA